MNLSLISKIALAATLIVGLASTTTLAGEEHHTQSTSLRTVEGTVVSVSSRPGEGNL